MKDNKNSATIKLAAACIILLFAVFTFVPAIIYGFSNLNSGAAVSGTSSSSASEAPGTISSQADAGTGSEPETGESTPGFLDGIAAQNYQTANMIQPSGEQDIIEDVFEIYDQASDTVLSVSGKDFLPAAVICEMPVSAPAEALKAQAVATYTYYSRERAYGGLENADFACDTASWQVYVTTEKMKERWGEDFDTYYQTVKEITDSVYGELLTQDNEPICAAYFSISCGTTEASVNVWGGDLPYLQAVASPGDVLSDGYMSTATFTPDELQSLLKAALPETEFNFDSDYSAWFQNQQRSNAGYTKTIDVCGSNIKGTELRTALSLSSTCFDISFENGYFSFSVKGRGHGVGMSQAGAIFMAQKGSGYEEILSHYYPGTALVKPA